MRLSAEPESIKCPFAIYFQWESVTKLSYTFEKRSLTWMAWALFCSAYTRYGWLGNKKGMLSGRDSRERACRGAGDSSRLPLRCFTVGSHHFTSLCCKRPGFPVPSPAVPTESKTLQSQEAKFSVHRPLGWQVVVVPLGHRGLGL